MTKVMEILAPRSTATLEKRIYQPVQEGEFDRLEVVTSVGTFPFSYPRKKFGGFAFASPIFICDAPTQ